MDNFTIEERVFLRSLKIENRLEILSIINEMESVDSFSREFLDDLSDKLIKNSNEFIK